MQLEKVQKFYGEPSLDKQMRSLRLKEISSIEGKLEAIKQIESDVTTVLEIFSENEKELGILNISIKNTKEILLSNKNQLLINEEKWQAKSPISKFLDITSWRILELRSGFVSMDNFITTGSSIDPVLNFYGFEDAIAYLPRALQVSFLSPFPIHWIEEGMATGRIGRLLSGLEMLVWYVVIIGFVYEVITSSFRINPLIPVLILSTFVIILLGYAVPNMGAIYRMRQDHIIPFYFIGICGVYSIINRLNQ